MDAAVLVELLQVGDESHAQFVQLLDQKLQDHNFKEALKALAPAVCSQGQQVTRQTCCTQLAFSISTQNWSALAIWC